MFYLFRMCEVSGKWRDGLRMSGWGGGEVWEGGRRLVNEELVFVVRVRDGVYFGGGGC